MAKAGPRTNRESSADGRPAAARQALVDAAIETLRVDGFSGASARTVAARAQLSQGLVFYHFGSVTDLLLAALDEVSRRRMARYASTVDTAGTPQELAAIAAQIFREDLDDGYVSVLVEMIAGSASSPALGEQVALRIAPWLAFTREVVEQALSDSPFASIVPTDDAAYGIVALYLGLEMLSHLDGDRSRALALFDRAGALASLVGVGSPSPGDA